MYEKAVPNGLTWEEKLDVAKEAGFDYIEISIDESNEKLARLDYSNQQKMDLYQISQTAGIQIQSMCLSGHRKYPLGSQDPAVRQKSLYIMEKALQFATDIGIRTIQLAGYDVYYEKSTEESRQYFIENLHKCAEMAAKYGVMMGFETMETSFMNTVEKAMHYVDLIHSPYLNVYPDLGNITNAAITYGTSVTDDLKAGEGHLIAMHLKEVKPGVFREVDFGTGIVDFQGGINKAYSLGVRRYVTEFWYTGETNWKSTVFDACQLMRGKIDSVIRESGE